MKNKKMMFTSLLVIAMIAFGLVFKMNQSSFDLKINDQQVSESLYQTLLQSHVGDITSEVYQEYGLDVDDKFWESKVNDTTPLEMIKERVHEQLLMMEANYTVARNCGYDVKGGLVTLEERMIEENESRKNKIENGEVVYGLKEYSLLLFANYDIEQIEEACVQMMNVSTQDAKNYYDEHLDLYVDEDHKVFDVIEIYYAIDENLLSNYDELYQELISIQKQLKQGKMLHELESKFNDYKYVVDTKTMDLDFDGDIMDLAYDFKEHQVSEVIDQNGTLYLIQCRSVKKGELLNFVDVDQDIVLQLKQEAYQELVNEAYQDLKITTSMDLNNWINNCLNR